MEIDGHPTQDMVEELVRRGAIKTAGSSAGPEGEAVRFIVDGHGEVPGQWLFLPHETYDTGVDEIPG